jgi:hypothetical protein
VGHQPVEAADHAAMGVAGELERHAPRRRLPGVPGLVVVGNGTGIWPGFALRLGRDSEMTRFVLRGGG